MIELELFYKTVEAAIRRKHNEYLREQKCLPDGLGVSDELPKDKAADKLISTKENGFIGFLKRLFRVNKAVKVKRYNAAVDMSLRVLKREFKRLERRMRKAENSGANS